MESGRSGNIYHLSPDGGVSVRDVVAMICRKMGRSFEESTVPVAERPGQDAAYVIDSTKARREFGWKPVVFLLEGIGGVTDWIEKNWNEIQKQPLTYQHKP